MKRNVRNAKNSLKFKAKPRVDAISVRVASKRYLVPVPARVLAAGKYVFLSFAACSEIFEVRDDELVPLSDEADATEAYASLNPAKRDKRKKGTALPDELREALLSLPAGYKIGYDSQGRPKLVKMRNRGMVL